MTDSQKPLDTWKEIATYFGKSVRTVQNWEKQFALSVRRLGGTRVQAYVAELEDWRFKNLNHPGKPGAIQTSDSVKRVMLLSSVRPDAGGTPRGQSHLHPPAAFAWV